MPDSAFHITVGTAASPSLSVHDELPMLKAAILYADRVRYSSITSSALTLAQELRNFTFRERLELLRSVGPVIAGKNGDDFAVAGIDILLQLVKKKHKTSREMIGIKKFEPEFEAGWQQLLGVVDEVFENAGAVGLRAAVDDGILEFDPLVEGTPKDLRKAACDFITSAVHSAAGVRHETRSGSSSSFGKADTIVSSFVDHIAQSISDVGTYPLFDDDTRRLVAAGIAEGAFEVGKGGTKRARHAGLMLELLERLPMFDRASVLEVLDIRRELERPLVRFHGAVQSFSSDIESAQWDDDFADEAEIVFRGKVEPAVSEIEDLVRSNRYFKELIPSLTEKPLQTGSAALLAFLSPLAELPVLLGGVVGATVVTAGTVSRAYSTMRRRQLDIEQKQLYFYYKAGKRLGT